MTNRERIAELRDRARADQDRTDRMARGILPLVSMAVLAVFAGIMAEVAPSFLHARPGFIACYAVLLALYWTIRMAGAKLQGEDP